MNTHDPIEALRSELTAREREAALAWDICEHYRKALLQIRFSAGKIGEKGTDGSGQAMCIDIARKALDHNLAPSHSEATP